MTIKEIVAMAKELYPSDEQLRYRQVFIRTTIEDRGATYNGLWLNKKYALDFIAKASASQMLNRDGFLWKNVSGDVVFITIEESKAYISQIVDKLDNLYLKTTYDKYKQDAKAE